MSLAASPHTAPHTAPLATSVLQTQNLIKNFGGLRATDDISLSVEQGARLAIIGPNGAGKTTFINLLTGVLKPTSGKIFLDGREINDVPSHVRVRRGLVRTFQINQLFAEMTPLETLGLAVSERYHSGEQWWRPAGSSRAVIEEAHHLLERFGLSSVGEDKTKHLPYGKQRLLEIAVALACAPRVLLLDEPAAGVPEEERHEILAILHDLPKDVAVLLIEHDMDLVFAFATRICVLVQGGLLVEGTATEIANNPHVRAVYLGEGDGHG